jgi:hypothetical protein
LTQLESLNNDYINFKKNAHTLTGKEKKFQNFIKKALDKLNEPYLKLHSTLNRIKTETSIDFLSSNYKSFNNLSKTNQMDSEDKIKSSVNCEIKPKFRVRDLLD